MRTEDWNKAVEWARTKPDGIFSKGGIMFAIKNGNFGFYIEGLEVFQVYGSFSTKVGEIKYRSEARKTLSNFK